MSSIFRLIYNQDNKYKVYGVRSRTVVTTRSLLIVVDTAPIEYRRWANNQFVNKSMETIILHSVYTAVCGYEL